MSARARYDAIVVGAGPNGLAAAIVLVRAGRRTLLVEARDTIGGAVASGELTLPGFTHDLGAAILPLGAGSPFLRSLPLESFGLRWAHPALPLAHPLDGGRAITLERSIRATAAGLGGDGGAYWRLMAPIVRGWERLAPLLLGPPRVPARPLGLLALARFGVRAVWPTRLLAQAVFRGEAARALLAGNAAHSFLPLEAPLTSAFALMLGALGHAAGWPAPQGGAQALAHALAGYFRSLGGEIETGRRVESLDDLPDARAVLLDLTPRQVLRVAGDRLPSRYRAALERYRYGPGVFKLDWALAAPIPWAAPACARAGTIHLGGTLEEIVESERAPSEGRHAARPFVLLAQPSLFDPTRAPPGRHTAWAYCHVPNGSTEDMASRIEDQVERFAPGFRERILARSVMDAAALERWDANLVGGDIGGGLTDARQLLARPTLSLTPYRTPVRGLYLCSASTPPGGGVHGMCGYHAAMAALRDSDDGR